MKLDTLDQLAIEQGCYYDTEAADRVAEFFKIFLRHSKGEWSGKPFVLLPWQVEIISRLFGWKTKDGLRRYRKCYIEIGKKNGKSTLAAAIALYLLIADGEQGAEIYLAASDREQASIIYKEAVSMVRASTELSERLVIVASKKTILYPKTNSVIRALSADSYRNEGLNASAVVFDELHTQKNMDLIHSLEWAVAARRQPLQIAITTAGADIQSPCHKQREYAEAVDNGTIEDITFLSVIYSASVDDDWNKPETWYKANPSLGHTITLDGFRRDLAEAQASPTKENAFRRYRLCQWVQQENRWIGQAGWDRCGLPLRELDGRKCWLGVDLSATQDLTSIVAVFPDEADDTYDILAWHFIPEDGAVEKERIDQVPYLTWARERYITLTSGNVIDYGFIKQTIRDIASKYTLVEIAIDRYMATQIIVELKDEGYEVVPYGQGAVSMNNPLRELEILIASEKIRHNGNPVLRWECGNTNLKIDEKGNRSLDKKRSRGRIDGIVALCMGLGRALVREKEHIYATRGILTI